MPQYRIEKDGEKIKQVIDAETGLEVPLDPSSALYCKFVKWATRQSSPVARSYGGLENSKEFLCKVDEVIQYCKDHSVSISAFGNRVATSGSIAFTHATHAVVSGKKDGTREIIFHALSLSTS